MKLDTIAIHREAGGEELVHANVHNHFNLERHLIDRQTYKTRRSAALAE